VVADAPPGRSIGLTGSTIDNSILWPLPLTMIGFTCLFGAWS
jgi:heme exporter protein C